MCWWGKAAALPAIQPPASEAKPPAGSVSPKERRDSMSILRLRPKGMLSWDGCALVKGRPDGADAGWGGNYG